MRILATPIVALALVLLTVAVPATATTHTVYQVEFAYSPFYLYIVAGDTVRWVWTGVMHHTVTSGMGSYDPHSGELFDAIISAEKPTFEFVFTVPDTVRYYCIPHESLDMLGWVFVQAPTGVSAQPPPVAPRLRASPNPFASRTTIAYTLSAEGPVSLRVYDARGSLVTSLGAGWRSQGDHRVSWDGRDARGVRVRSGVYFCRIETPGGATTRKLVLLK